MKVRTASRMRFPALERLEDRHAPATLTWTGAVNSSWHDPANWDQNQIPGAGDTALFVAQHPTSVDLMKGGAWGPSVTVAGLLVESGYGGTIDIGGKIMTVTSTLEVASGTITGDGSGLLQVGNAANGASVNWESGTIKDMAFQIDGALGSPTAFTWSGGTAQNLSNFLLSSSVNAYFGSGLFGGGSLVVENSHLVNHGTISQSVSVMFKGDAALATSVKNHGKYTLSDGAGLLRPGVTVAPLVDTVFDNYGVFKNTTADRSVVMLEFNNDGSVSVEAMGGYLTFRSKGAHSGTFDVAGGAGIEFEKLTGLGAQGGINTLLPGSATNGTGTYGIYRASQLVVSGGASVTVQNLVLDNTGATKTELSTFAVDGLATVHNMSWLSGLIKGGGTLTFAAGGVVSMTTPVEKYHRTVTILNRGTMDWQDGEYRMGPGTLLRIEAGGRFLIDSNEKLLAEDLKAAQPRVEIMAKGLMQNNTATKFESVGVPIINSGTFRLQGGITAKLDADYRQEAGVTEIDNATVFVTKTVLQEDGIVSLSPGSTLDVTGAYTFLDGTISNIGYYNHHNVGSFLQLGGTMTISTGATLDSDAGVLVVGGTVNMYSFARVNAALDMEIQAGAVLNAAGDIAVGGALINGGTLNIGYGGASSEGIGFLNVAGDYTQTGTLNMNILGASGTGVNLDHLAISGQASLGGAINISYLNGFMASPGQTFNLVTWGSYSGGWAVGLPPLIHGSWVVTYSNGFTIWVSYY